MSTIVTITVQRQHSATLTDHIIAHFQLSSAHVDENFENRSIFDELMTKTLTA